MVSALDGKERYITCIWDRTGGAPCAIQPLRPTSQFHLLPSSSGTQHIPLLIGFLPAHALPLGPECP